MMSGLTGNFFKGIVNWQGSLDNILNAAFEAGADELPMGRISVNSIDMMFILPLDGKHNFDILNLVGDQVQRSTKLKNVELLVCLLYINRSNSRLVILGLVATPKSTSTTGGRSEEHTSELQSRENLVCRLLLEQQKPEETATGPQP